jgi:anthranilate synthase component 1
MLELNPNSYEDFLKEAAKGSVVPVVRSVMADLHTPVGAFLRISDGAPHAFLLESIEGGERVARYSFLGAYPEMVVRGQGNQTIVEKNDGTSQKLTVPIFDFLRAYFRRHRLARRPHLPPLAGGAVGYLAYEATRLFEPILDVGSEILRDDAVFMFYQTILVFDRLKQRIEIVSTVFTEEAGGDKAKLRELYDNAVRETENLEKYLLADIPLNAAVVEHHDNTAKRNFLSNWPRVDFQAAVEEVKEYIKAGDAYQVVLSQRFSRQTSAQPLDIYRALRMTNPSPYMFYLKNGEECLIGASPEMLVRCRGKRLDYRPIAGTRKRGTTEAEDWMFGEELRADEKEVAEHLMLVDLGRNDIGRVAEYQSLEIGELMTIERYSHVQHLVSSLRARLRDEYDRFDALIACFPAGTVTGAPKIRAMQIIHELEPTPRGIYSGAVCYFDYADNLDSCIAIRTIEMQGSKAFIQAGAGIVYDSVPEKEYDETITKARGLVKAIEIAEKGL